MFFIAIFLILQRNYDSTLMIRLTRFTFVILFSFVAVAVQAQTNAYEELKKIYDKVIELSSLPAPLHLEVTSHAKIGLVFYDDFSLNQAFCAPNKIYEYSGFGIPMLANKIPGLENTVGKFNAGKCIDFESEQLMEAIKEIDGNYERYSVNALALYDAVDNEGKIRQIIFEHKITVNN